MWALVDVANMYVSCERVFDPSLRNVPLAVLSNGDSCMVARCEMVKAAGFKMGAPVFKYRERIRRLGIQLRSSNYELYATMHMRLMKVLQEWGEVEVYSIDEAWVEWPHAPDGSHVLRAFQLKRDIQLMTGLPVRIGLGPTRALSKVANALAKASERVWGGVIDLHDAELRRRMMEVWPVEEVWGVGPALTARLAPLGVRTAADLAAMPAAQARDVGTVVLERLVRELNGIQCAELELEPEPLKATAVTRQFGEPVSDLNEVREAMVRRAVRAAEKIRDQGLHAARLIAFMHGSRFKPNPASAQRSARLSPATNDPRVVASVAGRLAEAMFEPGRVYTKCGVMLEDLSPGGAAQADLFACEDPRTPALLAAFDGLNARYGRSTMTLASEGRGARAYDTRRAIKSPAYTTRLSDVPICR